MKNRFETTWPKPENKEGLDSKEMDALKNELKNLRASEIATDTGNYEEIKDRMEGLGIWEDQLTRVREKFEARISMEDFPSKEAFVWEMLTMLYLYEKETAEHCVGTYELLKKRIQKITTNGVCLAKILEKEGYNMENIYFATITHDIGKIYIPPFVMNNSLNQNDWDQFFLEMIRNKELDKNIEESLDIKTDENYTDDELLAKLQKSGLRSKDIVPIRKGLSDAESKQLEEKWKISSELPLMKIIDKHADFSEEIHAQQGLYETKELVGGHHPRKEKGVGSLATEELHPTNDLEDLLHLADVEQALKSKRHYKETLPNLDVIRKLKEEIEGSYTGNPIAYLWMKDKLEHFTRESESSFLDSLSEQEKQSLQEIRDYVKELREGQSGDEIESWLENALKN